jgi:2-keto-4-pentenoate hydratase/2-oxohepta-3-ene-1,7-dioic acid hydratase in catechol pathway
MKLATFTHDGHNQVGRVEGDEIVALGIADMIELLDPAALEQARRNDGRRRKLADVHLKAPIPRPGKYLAIGLNYADHIAEVGAKTPDWPSTFAKLNSSITGPYDEVWRPRVSDTLDFEGELGFVIGKRCRHVPYDRAHEVIAGYVVCNDFSNRGWQVRLPQVVIPKSCDTHGPFGPWLTTADEAGDPRKLSIKTWVNGDLKQSSNTSEMIFDCYRLVELISQAVTFEPGDVVTTGTPPGVGHGRKPPEYLKPGDVVRVEIENLGYIENRVTDEPDDSAII